MALSRDEVSNRVSNVLEEALGVDQDEITPQATLINDLGAESIDFLDISFQLEKAFEADCAPDTPFKIEQGELFPENLMSDDSLVQDGKLTDKAMDLLKDRMPHVDFSKLDEDRRVDQLSEVFTVSSLVDFIERKVSA